MEFCLFELGITKKTGFTSQETKNITDLAGIGPLHPTRFLLLRDGNAVPISYLANGSSNLHADDIILRSTDAPTASKPVPTDVLTSPATKPVADRLKEIEDLYNRKLVTDLEYQEKRAKVIAEL